MFKPVSRACLVLVAVAISAGAYGALAQDDSAPREGTADEFTLAAAEGDAVEDGGEDGGEDLATQECGGIRTRSTLTGDWHGYRTRMQQSGVVFAGRSTHFAFGIDGGVNSPLAASLLPLGMGDTFKYTGRGEYDLIFDLEKFGGLPHGKLLVRAEHWYGEFGNVSLHVRLRFAA